MVEYGEAVAEVLPESSKTSKSERPVERCSSGKVTWWPRGISYGLATATGRALGLTLGKIGLCRRLHIVRLLGQLRVLLKELPPFPPFLQ